MKRKNLLLGLIVILIISLGFIGVGYGLWSETLIINGTVNTGEVDVRWETFGTGCFEFYPWPEGGFFGEVEGKDVGQWNIWVDPNNNKILHFEITNGYPSYAVDCEVKFRVAGSIPVYVRGTSIEAISSNLSNCSVTGLNEKILTCDELTVYFIDNLGSQLHPGEAASSSMIVHIEQPAKELDTYSFDIGVCVAQWNEFATAEECFIASP